MQSRLCIPCTASLPRLPADRCRICALPLTSGTVCGGCIQHPPAYDSVSAPFAYAFPVDSLIHGLKYGGNLSIAPLLADALAGISPPRVDALIPLPLAPGRLRERGFNQAQELARIAGGKLGIRVMPHACRKVADTPPQAALPWKERAGNIRGTFVCDADLRGMRVAIVDDVMTTGATLNELARNVKRAGAVHVSGWIVARTPRT
jgi:ComF family protein